MSSSDRIEDIRVLAVDPGGAKFGFAVLEGDHRLIDWGLRSIRPERRSDGVARVRELLHQFQPDALIVEDVSGKHAGRSPRIRRLVAALVRLGAARGLPTYLFHRSRIRAAFLQTGAFTKEEIAAAIARRFPVLALRLPPVRKPWMSEDNRINLFEAAALALTFFDFEEKRRGAGAGDSHG